MNCADSGRFCGRLSPDDPKMPLFAPKFLSVIGKHDPFLDKDNTKVSPSNYVRPDKPENHLDYSTGNQFNTAVYCPKVREDDAHNDYIHNDCTQCGSSFLKTMRNVRYRPHHAMR